MGVLIHCTDGEAARTLVEGGMNGDGTVRTFRRSKGSDCVIAEFKSLWNCTSYPAFSWVVLGEVGVWKNETAPFRNQVTFCCIKASTENQP